LVTKKDRTQLAKLGAEWTVLDSEENFIFRSISEQYFAGQLKMKPPGELVELEGRQRQISERKSQISAEIVAIEGGTSPATRRSRGRRPSPYVLVRDLYIRRMKNLSDQEICQTLDIELAGPEAGRSLGLPHSWDDKWNVKTYVAAYEHPKCKNLVEKVISVARGTYTYLI
jgi:hypothetical protein